MSDIQKAKFDYNALEKAQAAQLRSAATSIKSAMGRAQNEIISIGRKLRDVRETLNETDFPEGSHVSFSAWLGAEFGMGRISAYNLINVADKFGESCIKFEQLSFDKSALYALAVPSVSDETRAEAIEIAQTGERVTHAKAQTLIKAAKAVDAKAATNIGKGKRDNTDIPLAPDDYTAELDGYGRPVVRADEPDDFADDVKSAAGEIETAGLKNRVKSAEVVHDTLPAKPTLTDDQLSDDDWLKTIPAYRALAAMKGKAIIAKRSMLTYRVLEKARVLSNISHHIRQTELFKAGDGTPFGIVLCQFVAVPHPREWGICPPCKGAGCGRCGSSGYDIHGGIDGGRMERGEVGK